ncbi:unnamed protein product [Rotaria socialis]|uniref:Uncharacterized protein n=1 Tax=Rotaria socialis TaxID=392032 RepID=A0A820U7T4_9BILA
MDEQSMQVFAQEQIMKLSTFGGARDENVLHWLQDTECIFGQVQLQPSNKYLAVQSYLADAPLKWFRFNKSSIPDWSSFKIAIVQAYQPSSIDPSGSNSNERLLPSPEIETSTTPEPVINDDQPLTAVAVHEPSSPYQLVKQNLTENSIVADIPNISTSDPQSSFLYTVALDDPITCEDELQAIPNDQVNLYSSNDLGVVHRVLNPVMQLVKVNVHKNYNDTNVDVYVTHTLIDPKILGSIET